MLAPISSSAIAVAFLGVTAAKQCAQFDTSNNLYLFGGEQDYNLGQSDSWSSPNPQALTSAGRPPWTGNNTACSLAQYNNALYVLDADAANPGDVYIYDFAAGTWSKQTTTSPPDLATGSSVLDHDTNVFFALPGDDGSLYSLDLSSVTNQASGNAIAWEAVTDPNFKMEGRQPVMSQASNHIVFFNVPGNPAGSANMFVIHYSYFQPEVQAFSLANGATDNFPTSAGQALPIPLASTDAGKQIVYVPDDFSHTYVLTHWTNPGDWSSLSDAPAGIESLINSTQTLPAPSSQDRSAAYAASANTLVQFTSSGDVYYLPSAFGNGWTVQANAAWQKLGYSVAGLSGASQSTVVSSASGTSTTASGTGATSTVGSASTTLSRASGTGSTATGSTPTNATNFGVKIVSPLFAQAGVFVIALVVTGALL